VFKIYGRSLGFELGGGGRYDGLLAKFGWDLPAVGFSFTLDHLLPLVERSATLEIPVSSDEVHRVDATGVSLEQVFSRVWKLREQQKRVSLNEGC
jgi:ATP phosphoribosyltransferase regulatory subunit